MAPNLCDITSEWRVSTRILPNDYQEKAASDQEHDAGIVGVQRVGRERGRELTMCLHQALHLACYSYSFIQS